MALKVSFLLQSLREMDILFTGNQEAEIYALALLGDTVITVSEKEVLYLADRTKADSFLDSCTNILFLPEEKLADTMKKLNSLLIWDYRRSAQIASFLKNLQEETPLNTVVQNIHEIMQNPVLLLDWNFQILAYSDSEKRKLFFPELLQNTAKQIGNAPVILPPNRNFPTRQMLLPVLFSENEVIGYLLVFEKEREFQEKADAEYAMHLSALLGRYISGDSMTSRSSPMEQFILSILQKTLDKGAIQQHIQKLLFQESEQYFLLTVEQCQEHSFLSVKKELQRALRTDIYELDHNYIALIGCPAFTAITDITYPELIKFLKKYEVFAGLSNSFFELSSLPQAYEQGKKAIQLRKRVTNNRTYFARYEDVILTHLLDIANADGINVFSFCHPSTIQIWEYDKEHGTEYLETLGAYVYNYCNLQQTADVLFIHRNTAYHRINTIKDLFHVDFDNPRLFMKLRISITVFTYLNILNGLKILGPLK